MIGWEFAALIKTNATFSLWTTPAASCGLAGAAEEHMGSSESGCCPCTSAGEGRTPSPRAESPFVSPRNWNAGSSAGQSFSGR